MSGVDAWPKFLNRIDLLEIIHYRGYFLSQLKFTESIPFGFLGTPQLVPFSLKLELLTDELIDLLVNFFLDLGLQILFNQVFSYFSLDSVLHRSHVHFVNDVLNKEAVFGGQLCCSCK